MVIGASIVGAAAATAVHAVVTRRSSGGVSLFRTIAVVFLLLSFAGPLSAAGDGATKVVLILMHVIAWFTVVRFLTRGGGTVRRRVVTSVSGDESRWTWAGAM